MNDIKQSFKRDEYEIITSSDEIEDVLPMGITLVSKQVGDNRLCTSVLNIPKGENANVLSALLKKMDILSYREILPSMNEIFINTVTQKA